MEHLPGMEQKIQEYVTRIMKGEDKTRTLQGLKPNLVAEIERRLQAQESSSDSPETPSIQQHEDVYTPEFLATQDVEALRDAIRNFVPSKYHMFVHDPDLLEEFWSKKYYANDEETNKEESNRQYALSLIRILEAKTNQDTHASIEQQRIQEITGEIDPTRTPSFEVVVSKGSSELEDNILYQLEEPEAGVQVTFWNNDKYQDAFAIAGNTIAVSDGAGSYERSGVLATSLTAKLAERASTASNFSAFESVFSKDSITAMLEDIARTDEYKNFTSQKSFNNRGEGLCTFTITKESVDGAYLEYASLGDSPLLVVDRNKEGEVIGFQLINDSFNNTPITQDNFYTAEVLDHINNPRTRLIGIRTEGKIDVNNLSHLKTGKIEKKEGRTVILASDSLIKMMFRSPYALREVAKARGRDVYKQAYETMADRESDAYETLLDDKGKIDFAAFSSGNEGLFDDLTTWKKNNYMYVDDVTVITIDTSPNKIEKEIQSSERAPLTTGEDIAAFLATLDRVPLAPGTPLTKINPDILKLPTYDELQPGEQIYFDDGITKNIATVVSKGRASTLNIEMSNGTQKSIQMAFVFNGIYRVKDIQELYQQS